ncbi:MAG TPA: histidinol-phosphatase [Ignavibacteriaceae bacterium]|nr:histidinol-phosphatase [Ignavibacteriaceae bacterium]
MKNLDDLKLFARHLSDISGKVINSYFRTGISVDSKPDSSPVTIADKKAEELMREEIMKEFPDHGIIGEEFGKYNEDAEYQWILDPIDGTKSFISGAVTFGTLISLTNKNNPLIGVINQPVLREFLIGDNYLTELNGSIVKVRELNNISDATLLATEHFTIGKYFDQQKFNELAKKVKLYRNWGDCYGYYLIATGYADIMIDPIMNIWDSMALIPVIKGAGGIITDYNGNDPANGNSIIAATYRLHPTVIESLN